MMTIPLKISPSTTTLNKNHSDLEITMRYLWLTQVKLNKYQTNFIIFISLFFVHLSSQKKEKIGKELRKYRHSGFN